MKICLFIASAINRWKEKVQQHHCVISAAGTALIRVLQHLTMLFAAVKGVFLEYKSSRRMKQFASMFLVLLIGLLTMSGVRPTFQDLRSSARMILLD